MLTRQFAPVLPASLRTFYHDTGTVTRYENTVCGNAVLIIQGFAAENKKRIARISGMVVYSMDALLFTFMEQPTSDGVP